VLAGLRHFELGPHKHAPARVKPNARESREGSRGRGPVVRGESRKLADGPYASHTGAASEIRLHAGATHVLNDAPDGAHDGRVEGDAVREMPFVRVALHQSLDADAMWKSDACASGDRWSDADIPFVVPELHKAGTHEDLG
jgi:hypothetical protein